MTRKFYNIEGIIRNGFKLSRNYETLDFNFIKLGDAGVAALAKSRSIRRLKRLIIPVQKLGPESAKAIAESESLQKRMLVISVNPVMKLGTKSNFNKTKRNVNQPADEYADR